MARNPRVTIVGSYAVAFTIDIRRMPAWGETILGSGLRQDHGGKGSNQAVGAARLGADVSFVAHVGADSFGEDALRLMREEGIRTTWVVKHPDCKTGTGFIWVDPATGYNCIVLEPGANSLLVPSDMENDVRAFASARAVVAQLEIRPEAAAKAMCMGRKAGAVTILNPAPAVHLPDEFLRDVDILTPNELEAKVLLGLLPSDPIAPEETAKALLEKGPRNVIVTLGECGAVVASRAFAYRVPAIQVRACDTTGAGDAFNAALAVALANRSALREAVEFAVVAGGLAVTKPGVIPSLAALTEMRTAIREHARIAPDWLREGSTPREEAHIETGGN